MKNRQIFILQATTTPYRTELFNLMEDESKNTNIDLIILYYKKMMANRSWAVNENSMTHKYKIYDCFEYFFKSYPFYFSFKIINDLIKQPEADIILGISWSDFIIVTITTLKRLGIIKNKLHFWTEANYMAGGMKKKNKIKDVLRNFVFNSIDGKLIIPGQVAEVTIRDYWKLNKEFMFFPNTVDIDYENIKPKFFDGSKINVLIIARLEETRKGVLNFIQNVKSADLLRCEVFIAGDGPDRKMYEEYIQKRSLSNINLLGNIERNTLLEYYKGCDLFVLPSFSDPNPLSVIEALFAGKPLLLSDQCGNKFEAVEDGENGYLMNPYDSNDTKDKFSLILSQHSQFYRMGKKSFEIAQQKFDPKHIVREFLKNI